MSVTAGCVAAAGDGWSAPHEGGWGGGAVALRRRVGMAVDQAAATCCLLLLLIVFLLLQGDLAAVCAAECREYGHGLL
jgi:hypothetical protein